MIDWISATLGDLLTLQRGFDLPEDDRQGGKYPVIASTGIVGYHSIAKVNSPGVLIGRSGSVGGGQYIKQDFWPLNTTLWVKDFKGNDERFCYYLLKTIDFSKFNAGSGVPTLNRNHIHPLPIHIPPLPEQRAIADILGALDDKIELNCCMNHTLEELAQTLFKHWFIDNPERGSWKEGSLSDLCEIAIGGDWGSEISTGNDTKPICLRGVDLEHLRKEGFSPNAPTRWIKKNSLEKRRMTDCDILIAGSGVGPVGRPLWISPSLFTIYDCEITYSNFCKRLTAKSPSYALFVDRILYNLHQSKGVLDFVNGTSLPNLDINGLIYQYTILIPPQELVENYYKTIEPFIALLFNRESQTLAELRDTLLPKLISGQVRVDYDK